MDVGGSSVPFLDIRIYINQNRIESDLYAKPINQNQLLSFDSFHPPHVFRSIVRSQLCRVRGIVSDITMRETRLDDMCYKFRERGYPANIIAQERNKLLQDEMRVTTDKRKCGVRRLPFIFQFHSYSEDIFKIIRKNCPLLR